MRFVSFAQTCYAVPSAWTAVDENGNYYYLRYRHGRGTVKDESNRVVARFEHGHPLDGVISLDEFLRLAELDESEDAEKVLMEDPNDGFYE